LHPASGRKLGASPALGKVAQRPGGAKAANCVPTQKSPGQPDPGSHSN